MNNVWVCHDSVEPIRSWVMTIPLTHPPQRFDVLDALGALGDQHGVFTISGFALAALPMAINGAASNEAWSSMARQHELPEVLPFFAPLWEQSNAVTFTSTVAVRRAGRGVVVERHTDAGTLLRELEPGLDDTFYRRFAARRPFFGVWSETTDAALVVTCATWTDLWFNDEDEELLEANGPRMLGFLAGLGMLCTTHGGHLEES